MIICFYIQSHLCLLNNGIYNYNKLWESEFDNIVSTKDKMQDININQIKMKVHDTYKEDGEITTTFEPSSDEDVLNFIYTKTIKNGGSLIIIRKRLQRV